MKSHAKHWDTIFARTEDDQLGWYEKEASATLKLLEKIHGWENASIFLPGAGTSGLIDELHAKGARLVLNDISSATLEHTYFNPGGDPRPYIYTLYKKTKQQGD